MAVTIEQVKNILTRDEPNYIEAAQLGPEAIPHLQTILQEADPLLASKAAYLASMINSDRAVDVVKEAAASEHAEVRAAAAAATRNLPQKPVTDVLSNLLDDGDVSVRKVTLKSISALGASGADLGETKPKAGAKKGAKKGAAKKGGKKSAKKGVAAEAAEVADEGDTSLLAKVRRLAEEDADPYIREIANDTLNRLP
ncbi:MAG TPA: hypothetical protein VJT15_21635 [Pyrinomonadaceae bacterium]|nr:hypothetical protein [Pyrinomonadaceae bacterium]